MPVKNPASQGNLLLRNLGSHFVIANCSRLSVVWVSHVQSIELTSTDPVGWVGAALGRCTDVVSRNVGL